MRVAAISGLKSSQSPDPLHHQEGGSGLHNPASPEGADSSYSYCQMPDDSKITPTDLFNKLLEPVLAVGVGQTLRTNMLIYEFENGVKAPATENRFSILSDKSQPAEHIPVLVAFDTEPPSEITCPNCDEPCADECCPNCGAIVWYPGHQISGGSL